MDEYIPTGFERGLVPQKIIKMVQAAGETYYLLKFQDELTPELVPDDEAKEKCPELVIKYHENAKKWKPPLTLREILGEEIESTKNNGQFAVNKEKAEDATDKGKDAKEQEKTGVFGSAQNVTESGEIKPLTIAQLTREVNSH